MHPHIQPGEPHQHRLNHRRAAHPGFGKGPGPHQPRRKGGAGVPRGEGVGVAGGEQRDQTLHHRIGSWPGKDQLQPQVGKQQTEDERTARQQSRLPGGTPEQHGHRKHNPQYPRVAQRGKGLDHRVQPRLPHRLLDPQQHRLVYSLYRQRHIFSSYPSLTGPLRPDIMVLSLPVPLVRNRQAVMVLYPLFLRCARAVEPCLQEVCPVEANHLPLQ